MKPSRTAIWVWALVTAVSIAALAGGLAIANVVPGNHPNTRYGPDPNRPPTEETETEADTATETEPGPGLTDSGPLDETETAPVTDTGADTGELPPVETDFLPPPDTEELPGVETEFLPPP